MTPIDTDGHGISLLYVEDEHESREMFRRIICQRFPAILLHVAENGKMGMELFKRFQPEIVITDINMPRINGIGMAAEIKMLRPATEVIALTAHSDTKYLMQAIEIGISQYLLKPTNVEKLFEVIDKTLAFIRSERTIARQNNLIRDLNIDLVQKATELELANRELEAFDYTVAHDLRSPLFKISTFSRTLLDTHSAKLDEASKGCLHEINREIMHMNSLVTALLRFSVNSRKNVGKKWIVLTDMANEIKDKLLEQGSGRQVCFRMAEGIKGYGDPELLRIVLENLLGNAWKFSVAADVAMIEFGTINKEEDLVYFVSDNGIGFDQQESENIFIPFQRLNCYDAVEGFGIGLATVYRIIQRHGGRVWASGETGKGATFYFTL